ncbi:ABC transporter permease [Actinomadura harenae]|uniref:Transport permease protein n=1 Tax=Actinomadura harenae TaxID=2483351 RepID=A0A3M2LJ00_9ACTN|nr:ABC transporter permease [Actinomadura harenae]RMI37452.1 ABC transporter permease [Actinomadura harenae]
MNRLLADTGVIFGRSMRQTLRSKTALTFGMLQPLLFLALMGPLLAKVDLRTGGSSWQAFVPGLLVQLSLLGGMFVGMGILVERHVGVIDRMRVTPLHPAAPLLGRTLRDVVQLVVQSALLVLLGLAFGLRAPVAGVLLGFVFVGLLSAALALLSYGLAMNVKTTPEFAAIANTTVLPMMLLAGLLLPMTLAPGWLDGVSRAVPFRYTVDAMRHLYLGEYADTTVLTGLAVTVGLTVVALWGGLALFRRSGRTP